MTQPFKQSDMTRDAATPGGFAFLDQGVPMLASGEIRAMPRGDVTTLEARLAPVLEILPASGLVGGALPFSRQAQDCLWQASTRGAVWPAEGAAPPPPVRLRAEPSAAAYGAAVAEALRRMQANPALAKVVLARSLVVESDLPLSRAGLLARLASDPAAMVFDVALPDEAGQARRLIGATPELLVRKRGASVLSHPLAGSARRLADPAADKAAATALASSAKDQREHAFVVDFILDTLAPLCRDLSCPRGTEVTSTGSMWHLGTRIEGRLRDDTMPAPLLAALLHPTPAVCGAPRDPAADLIAQLEPHDRDFYAGAIGWCDARGDGAWHVAIRCAELREKSARLYAGAGIVPGSDPALEAAETGAKFGAMLSALGLPADAALTLSDTKD